MTFQVGGAVVWLRHRQVANGGIFVGRFYLGFMSGKNMLF